MIKDLLDFIGNKESELGYNIEFGNKELDLSNMTIQEVIDHQKKRKEEGVKSTAVGRYQFILKTLNDLVYTPEGKLKNPTDLPPNAKFTPEVQDRAARILLQRRGLDDYLNGKLSSEEFANNVAKEWASMPVVTDMKGHVKDIKAGESYYAGDERNASRADPMPFLQAVQKVKAPDKEALAVQANTFVEAMQ